MRLRMCDEDREKYGGPEFLADETTVEWVNDLAYPELRDLEKQIKADEGLVEELGSKTSLLRVVGQIIRPEEVARTTPLLRARAWLALRAEGVDVPLVDFQPKVFQFRTADQETDAVPPAGGRESSPTSARTSKTATPASRTSTSASARSSRRTLR